VSIRSKNALNELASCSWWVEHGDGVEYGRESGVTWLILQQAEELLLNGDEHRIYRINRSRNATDEFANGSWWIEKQRVKKMKIGKMELVTVHCAAT
jgi:hypothetical protein